MNDPFPSVSRREMLGITGAAALAGCTMLPTGIRQLRRESRRQQDGQQRTVRAFVGSFHWGYFMLDGDGTAIDRLTLSSGDELRLTLFNVEAEAAVDALPQAVRTNIPGDEERARRNERTIPVPRGASLETLHDAAEAAYPDHSLVILRDEYLRRGSGRWPGDGPVGPWGGHHGPHGGSSHPGDGPSQPYGPGMMTGDGPGMGGYGWGTGVGGTLVPPVYLWHHSTVPTELGFVVTTTGSFGFACTVYCGYGHPYMAERGRVVVNEN